MKLSDGHTRAVAAIVGACVAALLLVVATAGPALAHGRSSDSTNFDSRILATPGLDDVSWRIYGGDEYVAVSNAGAQEIMVLGYDGEPYLRIGPEGVFRNRLSAATYVNADRYANVAVPASVDPDAAPDWEQVSDGSSWYWHDHRTHWMAPTRPPVVRAAPDDTQSIAQASGSAAQSNWGLCSGVATKGPKVLSYALVR